MLTEVIFSSLYITSLYEEKLIVIIYCLLNIYFMTGIMLIILEVFSPDSNLIV